MALIWIAALALFGFAFAIGAFDKESASEEQVTDLSRDSLLADPVADVPQPESHHGNPLGTPKVEKEKEAKSNQPFSPLGSWKILESPVIKEIEITKSEPNYIMTYVFKNGRRSAQISKLRKEKDYFVLTWDNPSGDHIIISGGQLSLFDRVGIIARGKKD